MEQMRWYREVEVGWAGAELTVPEYMELLEGTLPPEAGLDRAALVRETGLRGNMPSELVF